MGKTRRVAGVFGISVLALAAAMNVAIVGAGASSTHKQATTHTSTAQAGSASQPQPYSTADKNNTGANNTSPNNPYKSTRNGSPSMNGMGNGAATGKPCAGCVGKADNKFPAGQSPNGTDHNAGYECDRNHGIGQTNPAHTGCTAASLSAVPNTPTGPAGIQPSQPTTSSLLNSPPASTGNSPVLANTTSGLTISAPTLGRSPSRAVPNAAAVEPASTRNGANAATGALAFTGQNWIALSALAAFLLGLGLMLTNLARRPHGQHFKANRQRA